MPCCWLILNSNWAWTLNVIEQAIVNLLLINKLFIITNFILPVSISLLFAQVFHNTFNFFLFVSERFSKRLGWQLQLCHPPLLIFYDGRSAERKKTRRKSKNMGVKARYGQCTSKVIHCISNKFVIWLLIAWQQCPIICIWIIGNIYLN